MLNKISEIGDGFNPFSYTSYLAAGSTASATNVLLVNVSGAGLLTSISQGIRYGSSYAESYGRITVIIDGVTILNDVVFSYQNTMGGWTDSSHGHYINDAFIGGFFKFNTSLQVYHRVSNTAQYAQTQVSYVLG